MLLNHRYLPKKKVTENQISNEQQMQENNELSDLMGEWMNPWSMLLKIYLYENLYLSISQTSMLNYLNCLVSQKSVS